MRVLLDECLPRRLKRDLVGHDVRTAPEMGWASKSCSCSPPQSLTSSHQQNLSAFDIAVIVSVAASNRLDDLRPLTSRILETLPIAKRRAVTIVEVRAESMEFPLT